MAESESAFVQRQGWFKRVELSFEDDDLSIRYRSGRNEYPRRMALADVDTHTREATERRSGLLGLAVVAWIAAIAAATASFQVAEGFWPWGAAAAAGIGLGVAAFAAHVLWVQEFIWLYDRRDGHPFLTINARQPSPEAVQAFIEKLRHEAGLRFQRLLDQASAPPGAYRTACELEKNHTLLQAGVLERGAFERRKRALLRCFFSGAMGPPEGDAPLAELTQKQGLFRRRTFVLYPDRLERLEAGLFGGERSFRYLTALPEHPDRRSLPTYRFALGLLAAGFLLLTLTGLWLAAAGVLESDEAWGRTLPYTLSAVVVGPFLLTWWLRRIPVYVLSYTQGTSVLGRPKLTPYWWLKEGRPTRAKVEAFLKALARAHRDFHDNYRTPAEILEKFESLCDREILLEEELLEVRARLVKLPRMRFTARGWGMTPSKN